MDGFPPYRNDRQSDVVVCLLRMLNIRDGELFANAHVLKQHNELLIGASLIVLNNS